MKSFRSVSPLFEEGVRGSLLLLFLFSALSLHAQVSADAIAGRFSVSDGKQVYFAKGNLQYHIATGTWRFADYQYDYVAADITDTTYTGWIDLFGWGTGNNPTNVEDANSKFTDWGTNAIGTDVANTWRTLTLDEWLYLFQHTRWTIAKVNGTLYRGHSINSSTHSTTHKRINLSTNKLTNK